MLLLFANVAKVAAFRTLTPLLESAKPAVRTAKGSVFRGVTLIRAGMGNQKDRNYYPPETLKKSVPMFEGLRAFADHPDSVSEEIQPERSVRDMVGIYENARYDDGDDSIKADLRILRPHQWLADTIDELIQIGHADKIGLSINGQGQTQPWRMTQESGDDMDVNRVERFMRLRSTDIVTEAGAGGGFPQLLESARAEALQETAPMNLLAAIKEATDAGDLKKVQSLLAQAEKGQTKEAAAKTKKAKPAADEAADDAEETVTDPDADLDAAVEAAHAENDIDEADVDPDDDEDDEDADDEAADDADADDADGDDAPADGDATQEADETPDTQVDATRAARSAIQRQKAHNARAREAAIKGATGKKTGTVNSGVGRFTKAESYKSKKSKVPQKAKQVFRTRESAADFDEVAQLRRAIAKRDQQIADLSEALRTRKSVDTARKLLKESGLSPEVRALMVPDLVGLSEKDQRRLIARQAKLIEAYRGEARSSVEEVFDDIEGSGSTLRESFAGSGSDSFDDIFSEVGLTLKG